MGPLASRIGVLLTLAAPSVTFAADPERPKADLALYDAAIAKMRTDFAQLPADMTDKEWVKRKLKHMVEIDQYTRRFTPPSEPQCTQEERDYFQNEFVERWSKLDKQNTADLKVLLKTHSWFTVSEWGKAADNNAWLLVQHADHDPDFQKEVLARLERLYPSGETQPRNYAYLYDRIAASWHDPNKRQLQRYGTQGTCVGPGKWEPLPIEDPDKVDVRRAQVGLPPLADYIAGFKDLCK
jgi:hypothetical protein